MKADALMVNPVKVPHSLDVNLRTRPQVPSGSFEAIPMAHRHIGTSSFLGALLEVLALEVAVP